MFSIAHLLTAAMHCTLCWLGHTTAVIQLAVHAMMLKCGGEVDPRLGLGPSSNPWASLVPQRTIDHHGTTNFNNRYIQCMLPGGTIAAWTDDMEAEGGSSETDSVDENESGASGGPKDDAQFLELLNPTSAKRQKRNHE